MSRASTAAPFLVPPFLNCEGPKFDPVWGAFRRAAVDNALLGFPSDNQLQVGAALLIHHFEPLLHQGSAGLVVHLRSAASGDIYEYRNPGSNDSSTTVTTTTPPIFSQPDFNASKDVTEGLQNLFNAKNSNTDPLSFCLFGYITALFIEFRHTSTLPETDGSNSCKERLGLLQVAEQLLGDSTQETNFIESTGWPISSLDLHLSLYARHGDASEVGISDCHHLYSRKLLPPNPWSGWALLDVPLSCTKTAFTSDCTEVNFEKSIRVAGLGLHVSSTLEPVSAIRAALGDLVSVEVSYFGHPCYGSPKDRTQRHACVYKCQMLGEPCEDDAVAQVLKGMFNTSGLYEEMPWSMSDALAELATARAMTPALREAGLVVCSGPLVLCYLLDVLFQDTPLVYQICSQLLWGAPRDDDTAHLMLLGHIRSMRANPHRWLVSCNAFVTAQCLYQTGVELPIVPRVALYLPAKTTWSAENPNGKWREVLVLRARYWHRLPGQYFMDVLESYLRVNEDRYNMTFTMASSMGPEELPPAEISRFRAVVLVPNDLTVFAFIEAYAMSIPLFVPTPEWLYRLRRTVPFGFLQKARCLPDLEGGITRQVFPLPPFLSDAGRTHPDDLIAFIFWQSTSELHAYPAVEQFESVPALLEKLVLADLHSMSGVMAQHMGRQREQTLKHWLSALQVLIGRNKSWAVEPAITNKTASSSSDNHWSRPVTHIGDVRGMLRMELSCDTAEFAPEWASFQESFRFNAANRFPVDWDLWTKAEELWQLVQEMLKQARAVIQHVSLASAASLFHQALNGDVDFGTLANANHCHYGLIAVLFILARHCLSSAAIERGLWRLRATDIKNETKGPAPHVSANSSSAADNYWDGCADNNLLRTAVGLLGDGAALDFLEDSNWNVSSLDLAALENALQGLLSLDSQGFGWRRFVRSGEAAATHISARVPWLLEGCSSSLISHGCDRPSEVINAFPLEWKCRTAVVGVHPSLSLDVAEAVRHALNDQSTHKFFGMSCPQHHAASHHCSFRCDVLGQCENDLVFDRILGKMLDWTEFSTRSYNMESTMAELHAIIKSDSDLFGAELVLCTGPFVICEMLQKFFLVPMLIYLGLALTYLASPPSINTLLMSARAAANLPGYHEWDSVSDTLGGVFTSVASSAVVVTDLLRAAQFHHATGVWSAVVPPLSLYLCNPVFEKELGPCGKPRRPSGVAIDRRALALRPELWRRASFGPALRGMLGRMAPQQVQFQESYLSYNEITSFDALVLVPWDNDVMSFYEMYHAGVPLLLPSPELMVKWLPSVRWGSLEHSDVSVQRLNGSWDDKSLLGVLPWFDQATLATALPGGAYGWIAATDYYRLPQVLHFYSIASLVTIIQSTDLEAVSTALQTSSVAMRAAGVSFYRCLLASLMLDRRQPSRDCEPYFHMSTTTTTSSLSAVYLTDGTSSWRSVPGGGTCRTGFLTQADFETDGGKHCRSLCEFTEGCVVVAFNGLCCMAYDSNCNREDLRRDGDRAGYQAWERQIFDQDSDSDVS